MILRSGILLVLIVTILCDDHIPKDADPESGIIHKKIIEESKLEASKITEDKNHQLKVDKEILKEDNEEKTFIPEKNMPFSKNDDLFLNQGKTINGGSSQYFHNPSYITFTLLVQSRSVDCYYYKASQSFEVDYQVLKGGSFDIGLSIYDSKSNRVAFQQPSNDGNIKVVVPPEMINKDYSICFDNHDSSRDTKKVFMMIDVSSSSNINTPEFSQLNKLDLMHTSLSNIYTSLIQMEHLQEKQRIIETIDRSIMESNYEYVTVWNIIQITVMIIVSGIQLILIRSLFDAKGGIGAKIWKKIHELSGGRL